MWLLMVQGLLVNALVMLRADDVPIALIGILVTLSAFVMRAEAKLGRLKEKASIRSPLPSWVDALTKSCSTHDYDAPAAAARTSRR